MLDERSFEGERLRLFRWGQGSYQSGASASYQTHWLSGLLQETTGKRFEVQAMVLYPGWFVKWLTSTPRLDVLVLNPKTLPGFLEKSRVKLSLEEIKLITYHLSRYLRTTK